MWQEAVSLVRGGASYRDVAGWLARPEVRKRYGLVESPSEDTVRREVKTLQLSKESPVQTQRENLIWWDTHVKELVYFGQRFRDRPFITSAKRLLAPVIDTGAVDFVHAAHSRSMEQPEEMWIGKGWGSTLERKPVDPEEQRVEREWGLVLFDARLHSLFESFCQHLQGNPCWALLDVVERERTAYLEVAQMWWAEEEGLQAAYTDVRRAIQKFQHSLRPDARLRKLILNGGCELCP
jgi:hypothetical protein